MTDYVKLLHAVAPDGAAKIVADFAASMPEVVAHAELTSPARLALFLAEVGEESAGFKAVVEYGTGREYEGRRDLGNTHPGDGPRYKGRSPIMLTGRANYADYGQKLGVDLINHPEKAAEFPLAGLIAAEFWKRKKLNRFADDHDIFDATKIINGGENGLSTRKLYYARARRTLGV